MHGFISIVGAMFTGDPVQFGYLDLDISLGMNRLHTHRAKTNYKNYKVNSTDEKRLYMYMGKA